VQIDVGGTTDAKGRFTWENAPDRKLSFDVSAKGFMRVNKVAFYPNGQEHVVTLPPALVVTGTVTDKASGALIPRFRMITGWRNRNDLLPPHCSPLERFWLDFSGGEFHHSYEEAVITGIPNPGYVLKFEAEGYAPYVTRTIEAEEGVVELAIELERSEP